MPQNVLHWNTFDDATACANSRIGQDWTVNGSPSFVDMYHRGGVDIDGNSKYLLISNFTGLDKNNGTIEFWWKPHFARGAGGGLPSAFYLGSNAAGKIDIFLWHNAGSSRLEFQLRANGGAQTCLVHTGATNWAANDLIHLGLSWDVTWAAKRARIYWNGSDVSTLFRNDDWTVGAFPSPCPFYWGNLFSLGAHANARFDNPKIWTTAQTSFGSRYVEGFGAQRQRRFLFFPAVVSTFFAEKKQPQVLLLGRDLVDLKYIDEIQSVEEFKTFNRDKLIQNEYNLTAKNFDDFFSADNPVSMFKHTNWQYAQIRVIDEFGELIWDGILDSIARNHETKLAQLTSISKLKKYADEKIEYISADWETPADAVKNILDAASFTDYNLKSIQDSIDTYTDNSAYIKCNFKYEDDTTLQQAIEKLAEVGCADAYSHKGIVHFQHYKPFTSRVKVVLTDDDLETAPVVDYLAKEIVNDYSIYYDGTETAVTDAAAGNIGSVSRAKFGTKSLREIGGGNEDQVIIKDSTSAQYFGECYIRRTHIDVSSANVRAIQQIQFSLNISHNEWIDLNTFFRLTLADEGWTNKLFEVFQFSRDYTNRRINIIAYEVQE